MSRKPEKPRYSAGKLSIDYLFSSIRKNRFSDLEKPEKLISVFKVFGKIDFHYSGEVTHPTCIAGQIKAGSGLDTVGSRTCPTDILVQH